ncbi:MAG: hypothetical protein M3Z18_02250 [Gemmatimonadota bacterium]|nr:hypothetical protein [Gemmatimonadota bacterium]
MTRRSKLWQAAAALFIVINVGGAGLAIAMGEPSHAGLHAVLLVVGYLGWKLGPWRRRQDPVLSQQPDARIEYLQQSVDAVALEVERIGESQRYSEKVRTERGEAPPLKKDQ